MMLRFINDVIKPWEELNALLVERFAFQPDMSDVTRLASALAISIKHQADLRSESRNTIDSASLENRLMSDIADKAKHHRLRNPSRENKLCVAADFEYDNARGFRFIRNAITIEHASLGEHDFMVASLASVEYWMKRIGMSLNRTLVVSEASFEFFPSAYLYFNPRYCINMKQTQIRCLERGAGGTYRPVDPPEVTVEIFELPKNENLNQH